jgi:hypothetical protein
LLTVWTGHQPDRKICPLHASRKSTLHLIWLSLIVFTVEPDRGSPSRIEPAAARRSSSTSARRFFPCQETSPRRRFPDITLRSSSIDRSRLCHRRKQFIHDPDHWGIRSCSARIGRPGSGTGCKPKDRGTADRANWGDGCLCWCGNPTARV